MDRWQVRAARYLLLLWTRLYTLGLPPSLRCERRSVIDCDLWEQVRDEGASASAASLLGRWCRGVPSDVTWRLFDARRVSRGAVVVPFETSSPMSYATISKPAAWIAMLLAWCLLFALALQPVPHSLAWAAGFLAAVALGGWILEARDQSDGEAGPTAWPLLLAAAIGLLAAGLLLASTRAGLFVAAPLACFLTLLAVQGTFRRSATESRGASSDAVPAHEVQARAAAGAAIAIERAPAAPGLTRRSLLRGSAGLGMFSLVAAMGGVMVDFLYRRNVSGFGGLITAGHVDRFPPGTKTRITAGKFWLVNLSAEQGGPGFLALWQRCPHLGCVVPWDERFRFTDPATNMSKQGWFRCGCHQSTYNDAGVRVYGPATRSMDRMALSISEDGIIEVNTGEITNGTADNAAHAVRPDA